MYDGWADVGIDDFEKVAEESLLASFSPPESERLGWRGNPGTHIARHLIAEFAKTKKQLFDITDAHSDPKTRANGNTKHKLFPEQAASWRYIMDVQGAGFSGRLPLVFRSGRLVFWQDRPFHQWAIDPEFLPWVHYIPFTTTGEIGEDNKNSFGTLEPVTEKRLAPPKFSGVDLLRALRWVMLHPLEAERIRQNGLLLANILLTRDTVIRYLRKRFSRDQDVQNSILKLRINNDSFPPGFTTEMSDRRNKAFTQVQSYSDSLKATADGGGFERKGLSDTRKVSRQGSHHDGRLKTSKDQ